MSLAIKPIITQLSRHAMASKKFQRVNKHEPKRGPGNGIWCAIFFDRIASVRSSGLKSTSALVVFNVLIGTNIASKPDDEQDPNMIDAAEHLINAYSGAFTLNGLIRCIDLLGMTGTALSAQAGYREQDGKMYRVINIVVPMIVNDVWEQVP